MNYTQQVSLALAAAAFTATPAVAAEGHDGQATYHTGTFVGAKLHLPFGPASRSASKPHLALGISSVHAALRASGRNERREFPGIELRLTGAAKPNLAFGGQSVTAIKQRMGFGPAGVVLALGGLAAAAVVVSGMSGADKGDDKDQDELNKPQCFLPEKELCS